jgi:hypothetical protein
MQKYFLIFLILLCFSCESLFHEDDYHYQYIDNQQQKIDILNGIYSRLVMVHDENYFAALARSDDVNVYINYYFNVSTQSSFKSCSSGSYSPKLDFGEITGNIYFNLYTAIIGANRLLLVLSETKDQEIMGELYFLRAYCYFKLARLFGRPPLVKDIDVSFTIKKPSYREVYEFIEADMLKALELLPDTYTDSRIPGETPDKGTAKAMLAEIYLAMAGYPVNDNEKYAEAARLAGEVIEQADQYNYSLLDDFADLWKTKNRHNKETIFGLYFDANGNGTQNTIGKTYFYFNTFGSLFIIDGYNTEFKFFNADPNNYRKYISFVTGHYEHTSYDTLNGNVSDLEYKLYDPLVDPCEFLYNVFSKKWIGLDENITDANHYQSGSAVTLYLLRYAQTLLTYAESKARSGEIDASAYEAVNKVRRRANKLDLNSPSKFDLPTSLTTGQFIDSVVWERAWELCTEPDGRWFDIIRLNMKDKLADLRYKQDFPTKVDLSILNEDWYFYLIPQEDRWLNPNFSENK